MGLPSREGRALSPKAANWPGMDKLEAMKRVAILGSTGSIGKQTLDVIRQHPDRLQVAALAARTNAQKLLEQASQFDAPHLALYDQDSAERAGVPGGINALIDLVTSPDVDVVVVCVAGVIGLEPTLAAIEAGKDIALASKEVLVAAGEIVMPMIRKHGVRLTPIDSEHSAVFQCLQGYRSDQVKRVILTASGGPFRGKTQADVANITVEQALDHPTWRMGGKITIDSATLMNKGLETIEAKWLFDLDVNQVDVVVHPQSIVHSFVELADGSTLAQLGWPDMRLPIQLALLHPERVPNDLKPWSPLDSPILTFEPVDTETFRCLDLARECSRIGGTMPCAMNAANEEAANAFLRGGVRLLQIPNIVEQIMRAHQPSPPTLESILQTDRWARAKSNEIMGPVS